MRGASNGKAANLVQPSPSLDPLGPLGSLIVGDWSSLVITSRCDQACLFCYEDADRSGRGDPSFEEVSDLLREARARTRFAVFCGGEALLRPDILEIVRFARSIDLSIGAFTNGQVLARDGFFDALMEAGLTSLQVSFHFPDAATFALGTGTPAPRFERLLRGLANVRAYEERHPTKPAPITVETSLSALNAGRLAEMRALLLDVLGPSLRSLRLGTVHPINARRIDGPLLESVDERRDEVRAFFASQPPGIALSFSKLPLCLAPGYEHLSADLAYRGLGMEAVSNKAESSALRPELEFQADLRNNPYRWVCVTCRLAPLCRLTRSRFDHPGFLPTRAQRPVPYEELTPEAVLTRLVPVEQVDHAGLAALRRVVAELAPPEAEIVTSLRALGVRDVYCERTPILDVELATDAGPLAVKLAHAPVRGPLGYALGYLHVLPATYDPAAPTPPVPEVVALLRGLRAAGLPDATRFAGEPDFATRSADALAHASALFGEAAWPGHGALGEWHTVAARIDDGAVALTLTHPVGLVATATTVPGTTRPRVSVQCRDTTRTPATEAALAALLRALSALVPTGEVTRDAGAPPAPPSDPALVVRFVDRLARYPEFVFHVLAAPVDAPAFRRAGDTVLRHLPCPPGKVLDLCADALAVAMRAVSAPPTAASHAVWTNAIERAVARTALPRRFDVRVAWSEPR